ncbi:hypothetical protein ABT093_18265 [Kitasatospora sp. NPDC002551]|uniref:hypothetical protein n=1 Tax=Kitasatospora sp. NPDC002551 TaxID=3154539 RepID=UPI00332AF406
MSTAPTALPASWTAWWFRRCEAHLHDVTSELSWWGHDFTEGPPDAEDALILLRRTASGLQASGPGPQGAQTAAMLLRATAPLEAARAFTRRLDPQVLPLVSHHFGAAARHLAAAREHLGAAGQDRGRRPLGTTGTSRSSHR